MFVYVCVCVTEQPVADCTHLLPVMSLKRTLLSPLTAAACTCEPGDVAPGLDAEAEACDEKTHAHSHGRSERHLQRLPPSDATHLSNK